MTDNATTAVNTAELTFSDAALVRAYDGSVGELTAIADALVDPTLRNDKDMELLSLRLRTVVEILDDAKRPLISAGYYGHQELSLYPEPETPETPTPTIKDDEKTARERRRAADDATDRLIRGIRDGAPANPGSNNVDNQGEIHRTVANTKEAVIKEKAPDMRKEGANNDRNRGSGDAKVTGGRR